MDRHSNRIASVGVALSVLGTASPESQPGGQLRVALLLTRFAARLVDRRLHMIRHVAVVAGFLAVLGAGAQAQTPTTRAGRIANDIMSNMAATPAYKELRQTACSDDSAQAQLGRSVTGALDCPANAFSGENNPFSGSGAPAATGTAPRTFAESAPAIEAAQGVWTTRDRASCATRYYTWTVAGSIGMSEFRDQSGQLDVEKTLEVKDDMIVTETIASYHPVDRKIETTGTRWTYLFIDRNHVQVHNLTTGASFVLTRCSG
jgi:hypothetical protein